MQPELVKSPNPNNDINVDDVVEDTAWYQDDDDGDAEVFQDDSAEGNAY